MKWIFDDGGRKASGYSGEARDCAVRAIAIASGYPYQTIYDSINQLGPQTRTRSQRAAGKMSTARGGVFRETSARMLESLGFVWTPTMRIGSGCRVHLRDGELPAGRLVVKVSKHLVAVIDGVIRDNHDPSRNGTRCVYGYWHKPLAL